MKKALLTQFLSRTGLRSLLSCTIRWSGVIVLNYHRVGNATGSLFDRGLWSASSEDFADQIHFCKSHLDMISPADLPQVLASKRGRYGMITFDDGYRDNFEAAFPILKTAGVPATFFIATGFIDSPRVPWWDEISWMVRTSKRSSLELPNWLPQPVPLDEPDRERAVRTLLRAYKAMPSESTGSFLEAIATATESGRCGTEEGTQLWMDWNMIREMQSAGMTIGGHTVNHPVLAQAPRERQREEIFGCKERLTKEIGEPMRYFSYPVGGRTAFDTNTRECLREAGVQYAFSYYGGYRRFGDWDDYDIQRIPVETYLTRDWFRSIVCLPNIFS